MTQQGHVVAVFNTSPDTVQLLRFLFEEAGFVVVSAFTYEIRDGDVDLERFMRQHRPQAIVYDIAPPYEPNWRLFQHLRSTHAMRDAQCVLTSTNAAHVQGWWDPSHTSTRSSANRTTSARYWKRRGRRSPPLPHHRRLATHSA